MTPVRCDAFGAIATTLGVMGNGVPAAYAHGPSTLSPSPYPLSNVTCVQSGLNYVLGTQLAVDGIYGDATTSAVKTLQQNHNLVVDGIVGPMTGGWLIQDVNAKGLGPSWVVAPGFNGAGSRCHELGGTAYVGHY